MMALSLILTIAGSESTGARDERRRGAFWAVDRQSLMKRPTLKEMNRIVGSEGKKVTNNGTAVYVWRHKLGLLDVAVTGVFSDDDRLVFFERVSDPQWRWD